MSAVVDTCRLCLEERELQESHVIPKWAYKRARDERFTNPNPIIVSDGVAVQHSKQVKEFMLCVECEHKFGRRENYVAGITYQRDERAPLLDLVGNVVLEHERARLALPGQLNLADLVYFGASVVWRASISRQIPNCGLGEKYEEQFRSFLNDEAPFAEGAACCVAFHDIAIGEHHFASVTATPVTRRVERFHLTTFPIFGLQYYFAVGANVDDAWRGICAVRGAVAGVLLVPQRELFDSFGPLLLGARAIGQPRLRRP